jgi:hypothetical protein
MKIKLIYQINMVLFFTFCIIKSTQAQNDSIAKPPIARKEKIEITAEVNYMKRYLWRAILFGNNDVSQPSVAIGYKHFFVNLGSNINYIPKNLPDEFYSKKVMYDEQDIEIGYGNSIKKLDYEVKTMAYYYFNQIGSPNTKEASLKLSYPVIKNITAFTETVVDIQAYKGSVYNNTGAVWEYSHKKNDFLLQANTGFGSNKFTAAYFGTEEDSGGLLYLGSKAAVTHNFKNFYCCISGEYNVYTNKQVKIATEINNTSNFTITLGKEF